MLERIASWATELRTDLVASGTPDLVTTHDLVTLAYPTRFGLWRASASPSPFLAITNRMLVVQWADRRPDSHPALGAQRRGARRPAPAVGTRRNNR